MGLNLICLKKLIMWRGWGDDCAHSDRAPLTDISSSTMAVQDPVSVDARGCVWGCTYPPWRHQVETIS